MRLAINGKQKETGQAVTVTATAPQQARNREKPAAGRLL